MVTNTPGKSARLFAWQMSHYIVRGGPNDPVLPATGGPPVTTGGVFSYNSVLTVPPTPGAQPAEPVTQTINSTTGATTSARRSPRTMAASSSARCRWVLAQRDPGLCLHDVRGRHERHDRACRSDRGNGISGCDAEASSATMTAFTGGDLYGEPDGTGITGLATAPGSWPWFWSDGNLRLPRTCRPLSRHLPGGRDRLGLHRRIGGDLDRIYWSQRVERLPLRRTAREPSGIGRRDPKPPPIFHLRE